MVKLEGGKVVLREKRIEDAELDYVWRTDEEIARLDASSPLRMRFEEFQRLQRDQIRYPTPASGRFAIETVEGKYIGNCMFYDYDSINRQAEVGIVIGDRDYWSRAYGYDAVVTMLDYLFSRLKVDRLYLHTLDWNKRAQKAFQKCGFVPVKSVRRVGLDFIHMEVTKLRWTEICEEKLTNRDAGAADETRKAAD